MKEPYVGRSSRAVLTLAVVLFGCDAPASEPSGLALAGAPLSPAVNLWIEVDPEVELPVEAGSEVAFLVSPISHIGGPSLAYRGTVELTVDGAPRARHTFAAEDGAEWWPSIRFEEAGHWVVKVSDVDQPDFQRWAVVDVVAGGLASVRWDGPRGVSPGQEVSLVATAADAQGNALGAARSLRVSVADGAVLDLAAVDGVPQSGTAWEGTDADGAVALTLVGGVPGCTTVTAEVDGGIVQDGVEVCVAEDPSGISLSVPDAAASTVIAGEHSVDVRFLTGIEATARPVHFCLEAAASDGTPSSIVSTGVEVTEVSDGRLCAWTANNGHARLLWQALRAGSAAFSAIQEEPGTTGIGAQRTIMVTPAQFHHLEAQAVSAPVPEAETCVDEVELWAVDRYGNATAAPPGARTVTLTPGPEHAGAGAHLQVRSVDGEDVSGLAGDVSVDLGGDHRAVLRIERAGVGPYEVVTPDAGGAPRGALVRPASLELGEAVLPPVPTMERGHNTYVRLALRDVCGAPSSGYGGLLDWTATGVEIMQLGEEAPGLYPAKVWSKDCRVEGASLSVAVDDTPVASQPLTIACQPPGADGAVTLAPATPVAACPEADAYELAVEALDGQGRFVPAAAVEVAAPGFPELQVGPPDADPDAGVYRLPLTAERCTWDGQEVAAFPLEITVDGVRMAAQPEVAFACPAIDTVEVEAPAVLGAGDLAPITVTAHNTCPRPAAGLVARVSLTDGVCAAPDGPQAQDGAGTDALDGSVRAGVMGQAAGTCEWEVEVTGPWDGSSAVRAGRFEVTPLTPAPQVHLRAPGAVSVDVPFDLVVTAENRTPRLFHDVEIRLEDCHPPVEPAGTTQRPGPLAPGGSVEVSATFVTRAPGPVACRVLALAATEPGGPPLVQLGQVALRLEAEPRAFYGAYGCSAAPGPAGLLPLALLAAFLHLAGRRRRRSRPAAKIGAVLSAALLLAATPEARAAEPPPSLLSVAVSSGGRATARDAEHVAAYLDRALSRQARYRLAALEALDVDGVRTRSRLVGCRDDGACLTSVGGELGVDRLLLARVAREAGAWDVDLALLDLTRGTVLARVSRRVEVEAALPTALEEAADELSAADPGTGAASGATAGVQGVGTSADHPPRPAGRPVRSLGAVGAEAPGGDRRARTGDALAANGRHPSPRSGLGVSLRSDLNLAAGRHATPVPGVQAVWQPDRWGAAATALWVPGGQDRRWGLRLEGRLSPRRAGPLQPYALAGLVTFLPDVGLRAGAGASLPLGPVHGFVEAAYEYFVARGTSHRPQAWLLAAGVTVPF